MHQRLREALVTSARAGIRWSGSLRLEALYCSFLLEVQPYILWGGVGGRGAKHMQIRWSGSLCLEAL